MVTVVSTPQGHKITGDAVSVTIEDAAGDALVNSPAHGLLEGDYIYITSDIDEYNGFWYVSLVDFGLFQIKEHAQADLVEYFQDADIDYYHTLPHDWSSIFLPIVYKIKNNKWPANTEDTARTVISVSDDNGFTQLDLSGDLKATDVNILEFIRITGAADDDLNNIWQIIEIISTSSIVINLPYAAVNDLSTALVQYYYNNYQVRVKVFSGLNTLSPWESKKPYGEMAELSLTPDENNEVMFSVSDYIKSKVQVKNNLTLFSLPLNLDAFTSFFISTGESFDYSDNYALYTAAPNFISDNFEGYAIAGKLPFKNTYAGDYADYVYVEDSPALWLTNADRLLAVEDLYFDVSFIKNVINDFFVRVTRNLVETSDVVDIQFINHGIGVYRIPLSIVSTYESYCIQAFTVATTGYTPAVMDDFLDWANESNSTPVGHSWVSVYGSHVEFDTNLLGLSSVSPNWHTDYSFETGRTYSFGYELQGIGCETFHITVVDVSRNPLTAFTVSPTNSDPVSGIYEVMAPIGAAGIDIYVTSPCACGSGGDFCKKFILNFENLTEAESDADPFAITAEICIDILEQCEAEQGFSQEDARLLEDGDFRLLE